MLTIEQLHKRQFGLGATDIAPIMGMHPYKTAYQVYLEKTDPSLTPIKETEPIKWGRLLEDSIAAGYEEETGYETVSSETLYHPLYGYLFANPDRIIKGKEHGVEIKNVGVNQAHLWGPSGSEIVPVHHLWQVVHSMFVSGFQSWDLVALIGGNTLKIYRYHNDKRIAAICERIEEVATRFWRQNVEKRNPPPFIPNAHSKDALTEYFSEVKEEEIHLPEGLLVHKENYLKHSKLAKEHKNLADIWQSHILKEMGNNSRGYFPDGSYFSRKKIHVEAYTVKARDQIRTTFKEVANTGGYVTSGDQDGKLSNRLINGNDNHSHYLFHKKDK